MALVLRPGQAHVARDRELDPRADQMAQAQHEAEPGQPAALEETPHRLGLLQRQAHDLIALLVEVLRQEAAFAQHLAEVVERRHLGGAALAEIDVDEAVVLLLGGADAFEYLVQLRMAGADAGRDLVEMARGLQGPRVEIGRYPRLAKPLQQRRHLHAAAEMVGVAGVEIHRQRVPGRRGLGAGRRCPLQAQPFEVSPGFAQLPPRGEIAVEHRAHEGHGRVDLVVGAAGRTGRAGANLVISGFGQMSASVASVESHGIRQLNSPDYAPQGHPQDRGHCGA